MLKFGLLLVLANIFLKLFIGIGLWKMAMEFKSGGIKSSVQYEEEQIRKGDPNILIGQNDFNGREGGIFPSTGPNDNLKQNEEGVEEYN